MSDYLKKKLIPLLKLSSYSTDDYENLENTYKTFLLNTLLLIGLFIQLIFIFISYSKSIYLLTIFELTSITIILLLMRYLKKTKNYTRVATIYAVMLAVFFQYILSTGGVDGNGYIWTFLFPVGVMFFFGYKQGVRISVTFLLVTMIHLFTLSIYESYGWGFKLRYLSVYISLIILAYVYEYTKQLFHSKILGQNNELANAKKKAENADKLKTEFLAQMSHEIRTPINTILNYISILEMELKDKLPEELHGSFSSINNASNRLIRTIDLILDLSSIESGAYEPTFENINLSSEIIEPIVEELSQVANSKNIKLYFSDDGLKNDRIMLDKYTMTQTITNLVNNAIKYTIEGEVEIRYYKENGQKKIEVRDTGIGISDDYIPYLFQKFSQETQGYSRRYEGNGLGLALVKEYCKINNALISVETKKGIGTTFIITLN